MKKLVFPTLASLIAILFSPISAANAFSTPWEGSTVDITVGQSYRQVFDCNQNGIVESSFDSGILPPGLSISAVGEVSGNPTTIGTYTLSGYRCTYNNGFNSSYDPSAKLTFRILPNTTTAPYVVLRNLNTTDCEFVFNMNFPDEPDAGSVNIVFGTSAGAQLVLGGASTAEFTLKNHIYEYSNAIELLNEVSKDPDFIGYYNPDQKFACGDLLTVRVAYQTAGAPAASFTSNPVVIAPDAAFNYTPLLTMSNLDSKDCEFFLGYAFPVEPDNGSVSIRVENQAGTKLTVRAFLGRVESTTNEIYSGATAVSFLNEIPKAPDFLGTIEGDVDFACGDELTITLSYQFKNQPAFANTVGPQEITAATVEPTQAPVLYANQRSDQKCSIDVIYPITNIEAGSKLTLRQETASIEDASLIFAGASMPGGLLTATVSLNNGGDNRANTALRAANTTFLDCTGNWYVAYHNASGEIQAEVLLVLTKNIPLCNSGFTANTADYTCLPAPLGFYTTQISQEIATACPAGMTTLTTASRSINDCYKPIVQTITAFKAPMAIKLKGTALLNVITNTKAQVTFKTTGACTAKMATITKKVKGKKVTTKQLKVTAAKKAGNCSVTLSSPAVGKYLALSQTVKLKVSKTGK